MRLLLALLLAFSMMAVPVAASGNADTSPPALALVSPLDEANVATDALYVKVNVTDDVAVDTTTPRITIRDVTAGTAASNLATSFRTSDGLAYAYTPVTVSHRYELTATAADSSGNATTAVWQFNVISLDVPAADIAVEQTFATSITRDASGKYTATFDELPMTLGEYHVGLTGTPAHPGIGFVSQVLPMDELVVVWAEKAPTFETQSSTQDGSQQGDGGGQGKPDGGSQTSSSSTSSEGDSLTVLDSLVANWAPTAAFQQLDLMKTDVARVPVISEEITVGPLTADISPVADLRFSTAYNAGNLVAYVASAQEVGSPWVPVCPPSRLDCKPSGPVAREWNTWFTTYPTPDPTPVYYEPARADEYLERALEGTLVTYYRNSPDGSWDYLKNAPLEDAADLVFDRFGKKRYLSHLTSEVDTSGDLVEAVWHLAQYLYSTPTWQGNAYPPPGYEDDTPGIAYLDGVGYPVVPENLPTACSTWLFCTAEDAAVAADTYVDPPQTNNCQDEQTFCAKECTTAGGESQEDPSTDPNECYQDVWGIVDHDGDDNSELRHEETPRTMTAVMVAERGLWGWPWSSDDPFGFGFRDDTETVWTKQTNYALKHYASYHRNARTKECAFYYFNGPDENEGANPGDWANANGWLFSDWEATGEQWTADGVATFDGYEPSYWHYEPPVQAWEYDRDCYSGGMHHPNRVLLAAVVEGYFTHDDDTGTLNSNGRVAMTYVHLKEHVSVGIDCGVETKAARAGCIVKPDVSSEVAWRLRPGRDFMYRDFDG